MCGRFNLTTSSQDITEHFTLKHITRHNPSYNITPGQKILTIVQRQQGLWKSANLKWGLIPPWSIDTKSSHKMINARAETLSEKPSFRSAFKQHRCLIPATGFFEWQKTTSGKQAFHIHLPRYALFAFAGLWEQWSDEQQTLYSCTIITTCADQQMQAIHARMPVIIPAQNYQDWLKIKTPADKIHRLLQSRYNQNLKYTAISNRVNSPRHNDPDCLK